MYTKFTEYLTLILVVLILSSCASAAPALSSGDVLPVSYNSALAGMRMVAQGAEGTFVLTKDSLTTLIWPMRGCNGVGFVVLDTSQQFFLDQWEYVSAKANFTSGSSMKALTDFLVNKSGWQLVPAAQLAEGVKDAILATAGKQTWITMASKIPVFIVQFDVPIVNPFYVLYKGEY